MKLTQHHRNMKSMFLKIEFIKQMKILGKSNLTEMRVKKRSRTPKEKRMKN